MENALIVSEILLLILLFLFGTVIFSFLNVVIYRLPRKENFISGRSRCPSCGETLRFSDMVPILSWVLLGRRCRYCGVKISARYPAVEVLGGIAAIASFGMFGFSLFTVLAFAMCGVLTCVGFIDYDTMEIPDGLSIAAAVLGVLSIFFGRGAYWHEHLIGLFVISVPMLLLALILPGAFGGGDIKLMAGCGLFLGWKNALLSFFFAAVIGGLYAAILLLRKKKKGKDQIPFGPFLCMGVAAAMFLGDKVLDFYLGGILGL